jgi:single-strand DNA-binding protein
MKHRPLAEVRVIRMSHIAAGAVRVEVECRHSTTGLTHVPGAGVEFDVPALTTIAAYAHEERCEGGCDTSRAHERGDRRLRDEAEQMYADLRGLAPALRLGSEELMLKATLIGNLGNDPEMRYAATGTAVLRFNVAANYRARSPEGEWQDRTEWVRVSVLGTRAETLSQYLRKGTKVYVEGRLEAGPWTSQQGELRAGLEVLASEVEFMNARRDDEAPVTASVADERRRPRADEGDLEDLPF